MWSRDIVVMLKHTGTALKHKDEMQFVADIVAVQKNCANEEM